jgi:methylthioribose-1-phosphate isomerase
VDAIIAGADRIAENGDTTNKIGPYNLTLSTFHHGKPFYVATPLTLVDALIYLFFLNIVVAEGFRLVYTDCF